MGMCDPKQVRAGTPWYLQVNQPGFMRVGTKNQERKPEVPGDLHGNLCGTLQRPTIVSHNESSQINQRRTR